MQRPVVGERVVVSTRPADGAEDPTPRDRLVWSMDSGTVIVQVPRATSTPIPRLMPVLAAVKV
ncbi:hypothetical protein [Mycobacterium sp.]|uniref:hypothetical protein n=1 Tax=Mycobacterium sp. TaxID=1785 RepID=UPI003F9DD2EA